MTAKFVGALLVATGGVKTEVDPHIPDAGETRLRTQRAALAAAGQGSLFEKDDDARRVS